MGNLIIISVVLLVISLAVIKLFLNSKRQRTVAGRLTRQMRRPAHLLVVLGSGGHTEEMLSMLRHMQLNPKLFPNRTYIVSSGDSFSAKKAAEFEQHLYQNSRHNNDAKTVGKEDMCTSDDNKQDWKSGLSNNFDNRSHPSYTIVTVPRARRVHQSFLSAPLSTLHCLWACFLALLGKHPDQRQTNLSSASPSRAPGYPDIILTNGPGTGVCVIIAAKLLRVIKALYPGNISDRPQDYGSQRELRTIFIESWARVTTLSLSGKILLPFVDRFLVQWEGLSGYSGWVGGKAEYVGTLLS